MKNKLLLSLLILFIFISVVPTYGETAETQEQDGKSIAFQLVESTPTNLSKDVKLNTEIKLLFNKNVVNMTVKENNSKCIKLLDANNNVVAAELILLDDQIEPDRKREIIIKPINLLNENTTYKIEISSNLQAKNGSLLGNTVEIIFSTLQNEKADDSIKELPNENTDQNNINDVNEVEIKNTEVSNITKNTFNELQTNTQENSKNNSETTSENNNLNKETKEPSSNSISNNSSNNTSDNSNIPSSPTDEQNSIKSDSNESDINAEKTNKNQNNYILLLCIIILLASIFIFIKFKKRNYEK